MKRLAVLLVLLAAPAWATEYYFRVDLDTNMVASFTAEQAQSLNPAHDRVLISVTQAQYGTGTQADFDALDQSVIDAGIAAAKAEAAAYENWSEKLRALTRLFVKEINKLRALHGLPAYTAEQAKSALKNEM